MAEVKNYSFNPQIKRNNLDNTRFIDMLPQNDLIRTPTIVNFAKSSIEHLFTPGDDVQLNGYIGQIPTWNNPITDHYITEPTSKRQYYQLSESMVSYDVSSSEYQSVLNYPDFISSLALQGSLTYNESRLFEEKYYTWCPSIDLDKFLNYQLYYWVSDNSSPTDPDYIVIDKTSSDKNPWSLGNNWIHIDDYNASKDSYTNSTITRASRTIIEFFPNIELYEYGIYRRKDVNLVWSDSTGYQGLVGKTSAIIDGITVDSTFVTNNGGFIRILINNDSNAIYNNKIYSLTFVNGAIILSVDSDGLDTSGYATSGEIIKITMGTQYYNKELYWNGTSWSLAQTKTDINQPPLFQLYDMSGVSLSDTSKYPNCTFSGNKLFGYDDTGSVKDSVLNITLSYDTYGQIQYRNYLINTVYSYKQNLINIDIDGYYLYNNYNPSTLETGFRNDWYESENTSKQYIVDNITSDGINFIYDISQMPDVEGDGYDMSVVLTRSSNSTVETDTLSYGDDYLIQNSQILIPNAVKGDQITVKTYASNREDKEITGFYELPINLTANPNNDDINLISLGDVYQQFVEVLSGQVGFTGSYSSNNNYRNTAKSPIYGTSIVQNRDDLLLTMFLSSSQNLNMVEAIEYSKYQYRYFKNRFEKKITEYFTKGTYPTVSSSVTTWLTNALKDISRGYSKASPFYNSGVGVTSSSDQEWFIPPTPSYLGFYDICVPEQFSDSSISGSPNMIRCHDTSVVPCYNDFRDSVILALETKIYNSINEAIRSDSFTLAADYKETKKLYTRDEWLSLLRPFFETWCSRNNLDYRLNTSYNKLDAFTWNWSNVVSNIDGSFLPGSTRGIYYKYFNTIRPHTAPWEMLGIINKPDWWDLTYGPAPYTNSNLIMWGDIAKGYNRNTGTTDSNYVYSYLLNTIPVDDQGYLIDPYQCKIAKNYPNESDRDADWNYGDMSPIETSWYSSSEYGFSVSEANFLAKPARFISETWDTLNTEIIMDGTISEQIVNTLVQRRIHYSEYQIHNEFIDNAYIQRIGSQQYVSYKLMSNNMDITTNFADYVRNLDVRLTYKMAGYTDVSQITLTSDSNDVIPQENYNVVLFRSPFTNRSYYSGVLVLRTSDGYRVYGYDNANPKFTINDLDTVASYKNIEIPQTLRNKINYWRSSIYYDVGSVVEYDGSYWVATSISYASDTFDSSKWDKVNRPLVTSYQDVIWYNHSSIEKTTTDVPYGTTYRTLQDLANFLNGYQKRLEDEGFEFETNVSGTSVVSNFEYMVNVLATWIMSDTSTDNYVILNPLGTNINYDIGLGEVSDIIDTINSSYGVVGRNGKNLSTSDIQIMRGYDTINVTPAVSGNDIYGIRFNLYETEHVLIADNTTIFGDVLYNPIYNIRQSRFKISGFKSGDWDGRYNAPGFIITGNSITPNYERAADNFKKFFDTTYTFDNNLQERAWANAGFYENNDLTSLSMSLTNQFEFYQGSIQNKGTKTSMDRLLNSVFVSTDKDIKLYEEWAFRIGDYGGYQINESMDFIIKQSQFKNDPQLIEFNTFEYNDTTSQKTEYTSVTGIGSETITLDVENYTSISATSLIVNSTGATGTSTLSISDSNGTKLLIDLDLYKESEYSVNLNSLDITNSLIIDYSFTGNITFDVEIFYNITPDYTQFSTANTTNAIEMVDVVSSNTNKILHKDSRWNWRLFGKEVDWPMASYDMNTPGFLPNAGYVNIDTIDYYCTNMTSLNTKYFDVLTDNGSTKITNTVSFDVSEMTSSNSVTLKNFVSGNNTGYFRVNSITVDVINPFSTPVVINIGRADQLPNGTSNTYSSTTIARITYEDVQASGTFMIYPSELWDLSSIDDNAILAQFCYGANSDGTTSNNGALAIKDQICYDKIVEYNMLSEANRVGKLSITINCELIQNSMVPNQRVWVYENDDYTWDTRKLQYDGDKIKEINIPSYSGQGSVVSFANLNSLDLYKTSNPIILSGVQNIEPEILQNTIPRTNGSVTVDIDYNTSNLDIIQMMTDAQMNITSFVINITEPFVSTSGNTLTFDVGTDSNSQLLGQTSYINNPSPSVPTFNSSDPVTVNVANSTIKAFNDISSLTVDIVRSGNIYGLPNTCQDLPITTVNWVLYPVDENGNYLDSTGASSSTEYDIQSGTVTYGSPQNADDTMRSYWDGIATIDFSNIDLTVFEYFEFKISSAQNATIGTVSTSNITLIANTNNTSGNYLNPTVPGASYLDISYYNLNNSDEYIVANVENAASGSATITITYTYLNGFEMFDVNGDPMVITTVGDGGNIFRYEVTRFDNMTDLLASTNTYTSGDYAEVDDNNGIWNIVQYDGKNWNTIWTEGQKVISSYFENSVIYNDNSEIEETLELYDPYKGYIPSNVKDNIDYIQDYDPAHYNSSSSGIDETSDIFWNDWNVGKIWWDVSTAKYLDYENISTEYKLRNWGLLLPETSIDVYQWVRSPVDPTGWNNYVENSNVIDGFDSNPSGTVPSDLTNFQWVTALFYDDLTGKTTPAYFFWVLNPTTIMVRTTKKMTAYGISQALENIGTSGLSYYSVIDNNKVIVGGSKQYLDDSSCSIKIKWITNDSDIQYHKQWTLVRNGDTNQTIPSALWNKMTDCLVGWNIYDTTFEYNFTLATTIQNGATQITLNTSDDIDNIPVCGQVRVGSYWYSYTNRIASTLYIDANTNGEILSGSSVKIYNFVTNYTQVPDPSLTSYESNGNLIRPSQTWFPVSSTSYSSRYARKLLVQKFNNLMASEAILDTWTGWEAIFSTIDPIPSSYEYNYTEDTYADIITLLSSNVVKLNQRILVENNSAASGFWTIYEYDPYSPLADSNGLIIYKTQKWRIQDGEFWNAVDWYATGYDVTDFPLYTYDTKSEMMQNASNIDITLLHGTLVKVNQQSDTDTRWSWYIYDGSTWTEVAKEKSTIELSDTFWSNTYTYGIDGNNDISQIPYRDGSLELDYILSNLYDSLMSEQMKNDIFFTMVKASIALNSEIDWVFKTSFMFLGGYTEELTQTPISFVTHIDNIINYIDTIKPYHTTIRDYINSVSIGPDVASILVTDFDFPIYQNQSTGVNRILNPIVKSPLNHKSTGSVTDTNIVNSSNTWSQWYDNYLNTNYDKSKYDNNWNPIRKKIITIKFDRCGIYTDSEIDNLDSSIKSQYEFKGTKISSPDFTNGAWSQFPWDYYGGWENELNFYTGDSDSNSTTDTNPDNQPSGETPILSEDVSRRDFDIINSNAIGNDSYPPESIEVNGNKFIQPTVDEGHPEELYIAGLGEAFTIRSTMIDSSKNIIQDYLQAKDSIDTWELIDLSQGFASLISDNDTSIELDINKISLHDPNNPSQEMLDKVRLTYVDMGYTQEQINSILGRMFPGVIYMNGEKILYWKLEVGSGNVRTISNLQRNVNGFVSYKTPTLGDKIYDASILSWATMANLNMLNVKEATPQISFTLDGNIWKVGNLNICYKSK